MKLKNMPHITTLRIDFIDSAKIVVSIAYTYTMEKINILLRY